MKAAYIDTSALIAVAFDEEGSKQISTGLQKISNVHSSNLMEAETRSVIMREKQDTGPLESLLDRIDWVFPERTLTPEFSRILGKGFLRGADLWHLACALYLFPDPQGFIFLTKDTRQKKLAGKLGFEVTAI